MSGANKFMGGIQLFIDVGASRRFTITPDRLRKDITPRTRAFVFNSRSNPIGTTDAHEIYSELCLVYGVVGNNHIANMMAKAPIAINTPITIRMVIRHDSGVV